MSIGSSSPELAELAELVHSSSYADRAFADARLRMAFARVAPATRRALLALHAQLEARAGEAHAELRAAIAGRALRGSELRRCFDAVPLLERDHFVEEVLGVAYPPLNERALGQDSMSYAASGYVETLHAFDVMQLGEADSLLDIGAGMGKVLLLAGLLCGARGIGIEHDAELCERSRRAAGQLALSTDFRLGDAKIAAFPAVSAVFLYLPFTGPVLRDVMARLWPAGSASEPRWLCSGPLEPSAGLPLVAVDEPSSWLQVYRRQPR